LIRYRGKRSTYIIAEIGVNHDGSIDKAIELVDLAKNSGADAVKFQSFKANDLARKSTPKVIYQLETTGKEESHYDMLKNLELSDDDHYKLFDYCNDVGIEFISTPYSVEAVSLLEAVGVQEYKVASADIIDIPLLNAIAATGKPVILSTGMATISEIRRALSCFKHYNSDDLVILHCVSNYPCSDESLNLSVISRMRELFDYPVGFSDHSVGNSASCLSVAMGACVVEKHFTKDISLKGPDHRASSDPEEFVSLVNDIRKAEIQLGENDKKVQAEEVGMLSISRKSLVYSRDIRKGEKLQFSDFKMMRPGGGLAWDEVELLVGKKAKFDLKFQEDVKTSDAS
jgi:sialic acid synthase SpsE